MAPSGRVESTPHGSTLPMALNSASVIGRVRLALNSIAKVPLVSMPARGTKAFRHTSTCLASMLPSALLARTRP
ncbi:hypothetical protein D3C85_1776800 [compost metagenome]